MGNVYATEVAKFDRLASRWWDSSGALRSLHQINPLRLRYIHQQTSLRGARVLDVGCGGGILSESMAARGAQVTGIDLGVEALVVARHHAAMGGLKIDYQQKTVEALASSDVESYDLVTCMELLEHVPDPRSVVRACSRLMKPEGNLIFATINRNLKSFIFAIIGAEYILRLLPTGSHRHRRFIRPQELSGWGEECHLEIQDITGLGYNPFNRGYFLTRDVSVNYFAHFRRAGSAP
jgi:2-polyprenyl-6-hydroxyphenyl methylase / 3-demethylubiquinone-9 3-methyltransferase